MTELADEETMNILMRKMKSMRKKTNVEQPEMKNTLF